MSEVQELINTLRLGADISRQRGLNLDYAAIADKAADALTKLRAENERLMSDFIDAIKAGIQKVKDKELKVYEAEFNLLTSKYEYSKLAEEMKLLRDELAAETAKKISWRELADFTFQPRSRGPG